MTLLKVASSLYDTKVHKEVPECQRCVSLLEQRSSMSLTSLHAVTPTSAIMGAGLGNDVAMLTDGRFSGGSHGFIIGHITPEAQTGGPIALVQSGDEIKVDAIENRIDFVHVTADELESRKRAWSPPPLKATRGTLYKYIKNVKSASEGCVTDE